jgi:hypothetical protein
MSQPKQCRIKDLVGNALTVSFEQSRPASSSAIQVTPSGDAEPSRLNQFVIAPISPLSHSQAIPRTGPLAPPGKVMWSSTTGSYAAMSQP